MTDTSKADLTRSQTVGGAGAAAAGGVIVTTTAVTEVVRAGKEAESHINSGQIFSAVLGLAIIAGAGYAIYRRWKDSNP